MKLKDCQKNAIVKGALSIVIPKSVHQRFSETYGGRATPKRMLKNLQKAAKNNLKKFRKAKNSTRPVPKPIRKAAEKIEKITNNSTTVGLKDACKLLMYQQRTKGRMNGQQ